MLWCFFWCFAQSWLIHPLCAQVDAWFKAQGKTLKDEVDLDLALPEYRLLRSEWGAQIVQQYHGHIVQVPAGWMHAVFNRRPCLKIAYEFCETGKAWLYPLVSKLIAKFIGQRAAVDYMPIFTCAFN